MKDTKHTPGPWVTEGSVGSPCGIVVYHDDGSENGGRVICDTRTLKRVRYPNRRSDSFVTSEVDVANAALIASAPDLLSALEAIVSPTNCHVTKGHYPVAKVSVDVIEQARAIIAKAKGE